jgi:hypothetical protein
VVSGQYPDKGASAQHIHNLAASYDLTQIAIEPTRGHALLDLIFVSRRFVNCNVTTLPPLADSDHCAQILRIPFVTNSSAGQMTSKVDHALLCNLLQQTDWLASLQNCVTADDFAAQFTGQLQHAISFSTYHRPQFRRQRLPRHIVQLLRAKHKAWVTAKLTGDKTPFITARRTAKAAIRAYHRNTEQRLIYANDKSAFFSYIYNKTKEPHATINLNIDGRDVSQDQAADIFCKEFESNFSSATNICTPVSPSSEDDLLFNCTESAVLEALKSCPSSHSSADGISYKLLKSVAAYLIRPLNIVFQHCFYDGVFPQVWKHATILPLYKGRGSRSKPDSYRPISLCASLGKLLEKVAHKQLVTFLNNNDRLHPSQHGFTKGKSTLTNLLQCDSHISECLAKRHPFDIVTFDFCKAFDKASHRSVIEAAADLGVHGKALQFISSFLSSRTQQVKVGSSLSKIVKVRSGVVQGSVLGPTLFVMLTNSLLNVIKLPLGAYADDIKFIADVGVLSGQEVQVEVDKVVTWSKQHNMPLSVDKCGVLHYGNNQPNHSYHLNGHVMPTVTSFRDLGVVRSNTAAYSEQCQALRLKAGRTANAIRRAFSLGARELLWPAFQYYVLPSLMYCSSVWSPYLQADVFAVEHVQRKFTKSIRGLRDATYQQRLQALNALSLVNRRIHSDMVLVYKAIHGLAGCSLQSLGLTLVTSNTRGNQRRLLHQRPSSRVHAGLFSCRAPREWNDIPIDIINSQSLTAFKNKLYSHLIRKQ